MIMYTYDKSIEKALMIPLKINLNKIQYNLLKGFLGYQNTFQ